MTPDDYAELADFWAIALRNRNMSKRTITTYRAGADQFAAWSVQQSGAVGLTRRNAEAFTASLIDAGRSSGTAYVRQAALRRFSEWLKDEGETPRDELAGLKAPKVDQKIVPHLTGGEMRAAAGRVRGPVVRPGAGYSRWCGSCTRPGRGAEEVTGVDLIDLQVGAKRADRDPRQGRQGAAVRVRRPDRRGAGAVHAGPAQAPGRGPAGTVAGRVQRPGRVHGGAAWRDGYAGIKSR